MVKLLERPVSRQNYQDIEKDPNFERRLDVAVAGAKPFVKKHLLTKISRENCAVIVDYIIAMQTELNPSPSYRIDTIQKLKILSEFHNPKPFQDITRQD